MTREALEFDVLVIGGGVVGLTVAAHLADEKRVAVLEREPVLCFHATGRSSAMFAPNYGGPAVRPLTAASASFFSDPAAPFANRLITARPILHVARRTQRAPQQPGLPGDDDPSDHFEGGASGLGRECKI